MKTLSKLSACMLLVMLVSACAAPAAPVSPTSPPPTATVAPTQDMAATAAAQARQATEAASTAEAATLAAQPTATVPPTLAPTETAAPPTETAAPPTETTAPPTPTQKVVNTQVPPTQAPPASPTAAPSTGSIYSWTGGGPTGYTSTLVCSRGGGVPCEATMAPGDLIFNIRLESAADALEVLFYPFGLSVERDGANVADMYITADAGWLPPNSYATFGVSRTFNVPGHYVVRTTGCLYTIENWASGVCNWWTLNGTVVTFDIQ